MSPILMRPVREQLEHDRVIRLLQAKYCRKFEVAVNLGGQQSVSVPIGQSPWYPDLILQAPSRGRKVMGVVEVETSESVNRVEAMSQWAAFSRVRGAFHLYVPQSMVDVARQLCGDLQIPVTEVWAFTNVGDQMRFALVQRSAAARSSEEKAARTAATSRGAAAGRRAPAARTPARRPAAARPARRGATTSAMRRTAAKAGSRGALARKKSSRPSRAQKRK